MMTTQINIKPLVARAHQEFLGVSPLPGIKYERMSIRSVTVICQLNKLNYIKINIYLLITEIDFQIITSSILYKENVPFIHTFCREAFSSCRNFTRR